MSHTPLPPESTARPSRRPGPAEHGTSRDEYDALADLFLGEESPEPVEREAKGPNSSEAAPVEGLIVGHLPVLSAAWIQQYARHVSMQRSGPVALVRLRAGEASLDLMGAREETSQPAPTWEVALAQAAGRAVAWLLRVDETSEPRLPEMSQLSAVTLLTGADEAAVVSAYRTLKNLVRPADESVEAPELRFTIMGADPVKAAEATSKIERAAAAFLGRAVHVGSCVSRIGGRPAVSLYRGPWSGSLDELLRLIRTVPRMPAPPPAPRVVRHTAVETPRPVPAPASPDPVVSRLGKVHHSATTAPLASHIPSLQGLEVVCPYAPDVELAIDEHGTFHLLNRHTEPSALLTVAAWVRAHRALLKLALKGRVPEAEGPDPCVLHLFTDDPRCVRSLGDTPVRLHLLAQVNADGRTAWYHTPLN